MFLITSALRNIHYTMTKIFTKRKYVFHCGCRFYNDISSEGASDMVTLAVIKRTLKSQQMKMEDGHACLTIDCSLPQCTAAAKSPRLYINKTTGFFVCQCCKYNGQWNLLNKFFNCRRDERVSKELLNEMHACENFSNKNLTEKTSLLVKVPKERIATLFDKLELPVEYSSTLVSLNARLGDSDQLYVPLLDMEGRVSGYRVLGVSEYTVPARNARGVVSARSCPGRAGSSHAVIVPSLSDAFALLDARVPAHVVCLPYGLSSLPQPVLPLLERYTRIVLWFGEDVHAWDAARNFAKKLGEKRCFYVRPTDGQPAASVAAQHGHDLKAILTSAQPIWHKAITTFASLRQDVLSELQNIDVVQGVRWKRFPLLSRILRGHRRGELTVLTGPTGCGKTTFVSEYSLDLAMQGVSTLWGSFEIRNARLARTMLQQMSGCELHEHLELFDRWADEFERLPVYFMTFHGQQPIRLVMEAVEHATYVYDIAHVVIDNVQFMLGVSEGEHRHSDRFWKQDAIVAAFRSFATRNNCHVTLVMHPRKERDSDELSVSSIFGGAKASQEADNVLIIQDKRLSSLRGKKYLQVVKNRYSGDLGVMPMEFDRAALSYAYKKKKTDDKATQKEGV